MMWYIELLLISSAICGLFDVMLTEAIKLIIIDEVIFEKWTVVSGVEFQFKIIIKPKSIGSYTMTRRWMQN